MRVELSRSGIAVMYRPCWAWVTSRMQKSLIPSFAALHVVLKFRLGFCGGWRGGLTKGSILLDQIFSKFKHNF